jgi:hypothetical protein
VGRGWVLESRGGDGGSCGGLGEVGDLGNDREWP